MIEECGILYSSVADNSAENWSLAFDMNQSMNLKQGLRWHSDFIIAYHWRKTVCSPIPKTPRDSLRTSSAFDIVAAASLFCLYKLTVNLQT